MDYFCYISQNKVDQLLSNIEESETVEWVEKSGRASEKKAAGGLSKLFTFLKADISYGRTDTIQKEAKLKRTYVQKLKQVIENSIDQIFDFKWRDTVAPKGTRFYFFKGSFYVQEVDEKNLIASLISENQEEALILYASLVYFSENPVFEGKLRTHSANYGFFEKRQKVDFETVFILTSTNAGTYYGSPIYLKLSEDATFLL